MSFFSGGGSAEKMPMYLPGQSPAEQEARTQANAMLAEQKRQGDIALSETERLKGIEAETTAKAEAAKTEEEQRRQQRLVGGGIQRFLSAGYAGYGDSRPLGTSLTLGG